MSTSSPPELVLGLDTATSIQAVAVLEGDDVVERRQRRVPFDHSSSLLANIGAALEEHDLGPEDLDGVGVGIGPGSFTGTRIALSLSKALARGSDLPLAGVSSLACLAYPHAVCQPGTYVCAAYDARRHEVYTGTYVATSDGLDNVDGDRTADPEEVRESILEWRDAGHEVLVVGNGPTHYNHLARWEVDEVRAAPPWTAGPSPVAAALLGRSRLREEPDGDSLHDLEPNYIRPSSAEENRREE